MMKFRITVSLNGKSIVDFETKTKKTLEEVTDFWVKKLRETKETILSIEIHPDKFPTSQNRCYSLIKSKVFLPDLENDFYPLRKVKIEELSSEEGPRHEVSQKRFIVTNCGKIIDTSFVSYSLSLSRLEVEVQGTTYSIRMMSNDLREIGLTV